MLAVALMILVAIGPSAPSPGPFAVRAVPDEPGALMLPEAPTYQAVAADLDGDRVREIVRLVAGERGSMAAEAWRQAGGNGWQRAGSVEVVPGRPTGARADVVYAGAPVRLLVRRIDDRDRVTLARQPRFEEPDLERACCLLLDDLVAVGGELRLTPAATPGDSADAVLVLDLDGDGTDEVLVSRSLPPLGDIAFPTELRLHRWNGTSLTVAAVTQVPIGSGDTPFVLEDSDGQPGAEVGMIPSRGPNVLHRIFLDIGDELRLESSGMFADDALAVPVGERRGVAVVAPPRDVLVVAWPRGRPAEPAGSTAMRDAELRDVVTVDGEPRLLVRQVQPEAMHSLLLPDLPTVRAAGVSRAPAAVWLASGPVQPFAGVLPGGGPEGERASIYRGRLVPAEDGSTEIAALPGVQPIGLVGRDRGWMALFHSPLRREAIDPRGGRLDTPVVEPGSGVSVAPLALVATPEQDEARIHPRLTDAAVVDARGTFATTADGFVAHVEAPPGSRAYAAGSHPSVLGSVVVVPESGIAAVPIVPDEEGSDPRRAGLAVVTPAGHGYLATWEVRVLREPPRLDAGASTPLGSPAVTVSGVTAPYASVTVAGSAVEVDERGRFRTEVEVPPWPTDIRIEATDPVGNVAALSVSGVSLVDYRTLPWIPIAGVLLIGAAIALFLRVPRTRAEPRVVGDGRLEELDPD